MLPAYTAENRCARAIARHLWLYSARTGRHVRQVRIDLSEPVRSHI